MLFNSERKENERVWSPERGTRLAVLNKISRGGFSKNVTLNTRLKKRECVSGKRAFQKKIIKNGPPVQRS